MTVLVRALAAVVIGRMDDFPRIAAAAIGLGIVEQAIVFDTGPRSLRVPGALRHHRRRAAAQPAAGAAAASTTRRCRRGRPRARSARSRPSSSRCRACGARTSRSTARSCVFVADAAALAVEQQAADRDRDRHLRDHRGLARRAHRLGRPGEPRADGVRRRSAARSAAGSPRTRAGTSASRCSRAAPAGAVAAVIIGIPAARAGGLTLAVTTLAFAPAVLYWLLNPEFFDWLPRGRFDTRSRALRHDRDPSRRRASTSSRSRSSRWRSRWRTASGAAAPGACSSRCARTSGPRRRTASTRCARCSPASRSPASSPRSRACCSCTTST